MADQAAAHDNVVNRLEKAILSKAMDDERIAITTWQKELTERLQKAQNGCVERHPAFAVLLF